MLRYSSQLVTFIAFLGQLSRQLFLSAYATSLHSAKASFCSVRNASNHCQCFARLRVTVGCSRLCVLWSFDTKALQTLYRDCVVRFGRCVLLHFLHFHICCKTCSYLTLFLHHPCSTRRRLARCVRTSLRLAWPFGLQTVRTSLIASSVQPLAAGAFSCLPVWACPSGLITPSALVWQCSFFLWYGWALGCSFFVLPCPLRFQDNKKNRT